MQFVFPLFLTALAAIAIPIIIHLFYFRRFKKVYFTNVRFLQEVKDITSNRRKLRNLLVLLMRCLAIIFLVLAFAQPFIPRSQEVKQGEKAVSVFVDNSFSMSALSKDAPLLELAKQRARDIVKAYGPADRFQILTNDFEGRDQRLVGQEDALSRIEEIRTGPATRTLSKVLLRQQQCLNTGKAENKIAFLVSDFQENISDLNNFKDTLIEVNLVPMRAVRENNISIDSVWFESPVQILNQPANLLVKISNRGEEDAEEVRVALRHDGQSKPVGVLPIPARGSKLDTVSFNILHPGWHEAKLSVSDYPVQFDDDYFISFYVAERINVLCINGAQQNKYLNNAFAGARYFQLDNADVRALDYSKFANYQLIVLNEATLITSGLTQELKAFAQNGGNVLVFPAQNADLNSYNGLLQNFDAGSLGAYEPTPRQASQINTEEYVFNDVFLNKSANLRLPATQGNFKIAPQPRRIYPDLPRRLGHAGQISSRGRRLLFKRGSARRKSETTWCATAKFLSPCCSKQPLRVPKAVKLLMLSVKTRSWKRTTRCRPSGEMVYKLSAVGDEPGAAQTTTAPGGQTNQSKAEFIPEQRILGAKVLLTPGTQVEHAGWYRLTLRSDSTLAEYAFNYDRRESDLRYRSAETLAEDLPANMKVLAENAEANFTQVVDEQNQGVVLWRWCIVFALLFLALEVLFLRLWKV
jgi:hypothetical protein